MRFATFAKLERGSARVNLLPLARRPQIESASDNEDTRFEELLDWLDRFPELDKASIEPASSDASFRRYFRIRGAGVSRIVMDAPPRREDCRPFVRVAGYLERMGLNSPRVLAEDHERGFLLLSDLGATVYLDVLRETPERAAELYADALDALCTMQVEGQLFQSALPPYDRELLEFEISLFHDWLCGRHLGLHFSSEDERHWAACREFLVRNALDQPRVFVHRDYHSRNLMVTPRHNPGILDFQDAVEGPVTYDLVSLLRDCYLNWPAQRVHDWALEFFRRLDGRILGRMDASSFARSFDLMGVQRHLKAAGIFARLWHRDGKEGYLGDVPRTLRYIVAIAPGYPELAWLAALVEERCLPRLEPAS